MATFLQLERQIPTPLDLLAYVSTVYLLLQYLLSRTRHQIKYMDLRIARAFDQVWGHVKPESARDRTSDDA